MRRHRTFPYEDSFAWFALSYGHVSRDWEELQFKYDKIRHLEGLVKEWEDKLEPHIQNNTTGPRVKCQCSSCGDSNRVLARDSYNNVLYYAGGSIVLYRTACEHRIRDAQRQLDLAFEAVGPADEHLRREAFNTYDL